MAEKPSGGCWTWDIRRGSFRAKPTWSLLNSYRLSAVGSQLSAIHYWLVIKGHTARQRSSRKLTPDSRRLLPHRLREGRYGVDINRHIRCGLQGGLQLRRHSTVLGEP